MKHIRHFLAMLTLVASTMIVGGFTLLGIWYSGLWFAPTVLIVLLCFFAFKIAFSYLLNVGIIHVNELNDFNSKRNKLKENLKKLEL